jgi:hypothetical protein
MNSVVEWLESPAGLEWADGYFSPDPSHCHDMIEVINDYAEDVVADHRCSSSKWMLELLKEDEPIWADLTWTPDQPPDRV